MGCKLGGKDVRHGMSRTRLYKAWVAMMNRCGHYKCSNPSATKYYIKKGIAVCAEWRTFLPFAKWALANGYADNLTLDRVKSEQCYTPGNCQWITMAANLRKRSGVVLTMEKAREIRRRKAAGERAVDLAREFGIGTPSIYKVCSGAKWAEGVA
jgi:hypothetical protein